MWHLLKHLFNHGGKHAHHAAHHAAHHIAPTLAQVAQVASVASSVVGGVNSSVTLYERLKNKAEVANNGDAGIQDEEDKTLFNDFLFRIETLDRTIQTFSSEIQFLKDKNIELTNDIQTLKNTKSNLDMLAKGHSEQLSRNKEALNKAEGKLEILAAENKSIGFYLQKTKKSIKSLTIIIVTISLIMTVVAVFFYYKHLQ